MAENTTDANSDNSTEVEDVDSSESSPEVELQPIQDSDGFVSTTAWKEVEKETSDKEQQDKDTSEKTEHKTKAEETKQKPYHEDPAWQRILKERDEANARAAALERNQSSKEKSKSTNVKRGSKVLAMERDDIVDKFTTDPHAFLKDYAIDIRDEIFNALEEKTQIESQKSAQQKAQEASQKTLTDFFMDKADGVELLQSGKIQQFMKDNPGHNAMSAYYQLSSAKETVGKSEVDKLVKKAVADAEKKFKSELKAMGKANSNVTAQSSKIIRNTADELKNPDKHGGPRAVAARRYRERMSSL